MIQDITEIFHNEYKNATPSDADYVMFVKGRSVLVRKSCERIEYPSYREMLELGMDSKEALRYLFCMEIEGKIVNFFLGDNELLTESVMERFDFDNHNLFRTAVPKYMAFAGVTACQLANWYDSTRFCGHCGEALVHDEKERMMKCPKCGAMHFPKISPAVIVAVCDGDRIMMTKYAGRDYKNYALIAGFCEVGESPEQTVAREVMEEVGVKVKNIRYYKSQPWSFSDTLLLGYYCDLDGDDSVKMDENELSVAEWIKREDIPTEFDDISLTNEMIVRFKNGEKI